MNTLLSFEHKDIVCERCRKLSLPLSEYNFPNLYLFRKVHNYHLIEPLPGCYAIIGVSYHGHRFLMPLQHPENWTTLISVAQEHKVDYIYPLYQGWWPEVQTLGVALDNSEDSSDYIYDADLIRTFRGRHYDGQRNLVRNFLSLHSIETQELTSANMQHAKQIVAGWGKTDSGSDSDACHEAIEMAAALDLQGWVHYVDEKPAGVLIGGHLTRDTYLIHFAKQFPVYRGLYQYMFQNCAGSISPQFNYLNFEQDLGIDSLKHSKLSYHPRLLLKKGRLWVTPRVDTSA